MQATRRTNNGATLRHCCPPAKSGGQPRTTNLRDVFDAILYMASTGCQWLMFQTIFRRSRQFAGISTIGVMTVFFEQSTTTWLWRREKLWDKRGAHLRVWSIARMSKPRNSDIFGVMMRGRRPTGGIAISSSDPVLQRASSFSPSRGGRTNGCMAWSMP